MSLPAGPTITLATEAASNAKSANGGGTRAKFGRIVPLKVAAGGVVGRRIPSAPDRARTARRISPQEPDQ